MNSGDHDVELRHETEAVTGGRGCPLINDMDRVAKQCVIFEDSMFGHEHYVS